MPSSPTPEGVVTLEVREPEPWVPGTTLHAGLAITLDPCDPSLDTFWEGNIGVSILGPAGQVKSADGTGQEEVLEPADKTPMDWTRDGGFLLLDTPFSNPKTGNDIWALSLSGPNAHKPMALRQTEFAERWPRVSPDGRWLAYDSNESKRSEVYVVGFPSLTGRWQISANGGTRPV